MVTSSNLVCSILAYKTSDETIIHATWPKSSPQFCSSPSRGIAPVKEAAEADPIVWVAFAFALRPWALAFLSANGVSFVVEILVTLERS